MTDDRRRLDGDVHVPADTVCQHCGSKDFEMWNPSASKDPLFNEVHCAKCGRFIRVWNSV